MVFNAGKITPGFFVAGDLRLNNVDLGALELQENDADGSLRAAINAVDGVNCHFNEGQELIIESDDPVLVNGTNTHGHNFVIENLAQGLYS